MLDGKNKPMKGRRIVVTRAAEQGREVARLLEQMGAEVLLLPLVGFNDPVETEALDTAIRTLGSFDWVIFTSANAVKYFAKRWCFLNGVAWVKLPEPRLRVACVGPATAEAAAIEEWRVDFVPKDHSAAALAAEMAKQVAGKRILLPRSDRASVELPAALRAAGAAVIEVVAYQTGAVKAVNEETMARIRHGEVDAVSFASPSAFQTFADMLGGEAVRRNYARVALVAIGPTTAAAIRAAGLEVAAEAGTSTAKGLAQALLQFFESGERRAERTE